MEEKRPTRRRWYRFSLRTLFVVVTVVCVWLGYSANWIRQRRNFLREEAISVSTEPAPILIENWKSEEPATPFILRPFGEEAVFAIRVPMHEQETFRLAHELFPEAYIFGWDEGSITNSQVVIVCPW